MKVLLANVEDVLREAAARWTLMAYFILSSLFILIVALGVNLDIVDGALAGARLFGRNARIDSPMAMDRLVLGFESGFASFLYLIGIFLAIFATAHLVPRLQEKGTIDLYLSRPVGRLQLLASRYVAGLLLAATNIVYLIGSIWLMLIWKTHIVHPRFLLSGVIILFVVAVLLAFAFFVGVVTSSTAVSIMATYAIFLFGALLAGHDRLAAAVSKDWQASLIHALYWIFPKTAELGQAVFGAVSGGQLSRRAIDTLTVPIFGSTLIFGLVCFTLAALVFQRKEF